MTDNKTKPTTVKINDFLETVSKQRHGESLQLIDIMKTISGEAPVMWGPSIIGFGTKHYEYETGRQGDMPRLSFSPRKTSITVYFNEGFNGYGQELAKLGKYKNSVSCLYINKLSDINIDVLNNMLAQSYAADSRPNPKPVTAEDYIASVPQASRKAFEELRQIVKDTLPNANEVLSYGIVGYKIDDKRARVFISGWKDHVAMYPIPRNPELVDELKPYIKGKGTLWFQIDQSLPKKLIIKTIKALSGL